MEICRKVLTGLVCLLPVMTGGFVSGAFPAAGDTTAAIEPLVWSSVPLPTEGVSGGWVLAPGASIRCLQTASDGTLYAAVDGLGEQLFRSTDGGRRWNPIGQVQETIVDIAIPAGDASTIFYATETTVYYSIDNGKTFTRIGSSPGGAGSNNIVITSIAAVYLDNMIVAVGTRDRDDGDYGGVYVFNEAGGTYSWKDTGLTGFDVVRVAFSPAYEHDRLLTAIITDETDTWVSFRVENSDWNAVLADVRLVRDDALPPVSIPALTGSLAFPPDFNGMNNPVLYAGISTGTNEGDVYRINPGITAGTDLNAGSRSGHDNLDISGLTAHEQDGNIVLTASAANLPLLLTSHDAGYVWSSGQPPAGDAVTALAASPLVPGRFYAATSGLSAGLSMSDDGGDTWRQISLLNDVIIAIVDTAVSPVHETDSTLFILTLGNGFSLWRSVDGGNSWERLHSGMNDINRINMAPGFGTVNQSVFMSGTETGIPALWISHDSGQTFRTRSTINPETGLPFTVDAWAIADSATFIIGSFNNGSPAIFTTRNGGFFYAKGMPLGTNIVTAVALSPDYENDQGIIAADADGRVYYSEKDEPFRQLPAAAWAPPFFPTVSLGFDPGFATNKTIYAASDFPGAGIWRFSIGKSTEWENIRAGLPAGAMIQQIALSEHGILYAVNNTDGGGLERCLNPAAASNLMWDTVTRGLPATAALAGLSMSGKCIWSVDGAHDRLMVFCDTLSERIVLQSPDHASSGLGNNAGGTIRGIRLEWETSSQATRYHWQCDDDANFTSIRDGFENETAAGYARLPELEAAMTYYWRVRAVGPVRSPWSETRAFITSMAGDIVTLLPEQPPNGTTDVPLKPYFQWPAILGADSYELFVDTDANFSSPVIERTSGNALPVNGWHCDVPLLPSTTYYWKFRARSGSTFSQWSSPGMFTTVALQPLSTPDQKGEVISVLTEVGTTATPIPPEPDTAAPVPPVTVLVTAPAGMIQGMDWLMPLTAGLLGCTLLVLIVLVIVIAKVRIR